MEQVLQHEHRSKKEGVTLIEAVIAIAIVVIISAAATSVAIYSSNSIKNATVKRFFRNEVDTIAGLYLAYDGDDFSKSMKAFCGVNETFTLENYVYYYDSAFAMVEESASYDFRLNLNFDGSTLNLSSAYKDGTGIYSRSVSK